MADGFAVAGRSRLATAERGEAAWLAKINAHLGVEWFSTLDGDVNDSFHALTYTPDGLLVAGRSNSLTGVGQAANDHWIVVGKYPVNGSIVLKPEVNVTARHMEPGVRDSGNDPSVSNPGVVMDADVSVQDLEVRSVAAIGNLYVSAAPRLCVNKLTDTGRVSTLDACLVDADGDGVDDALDNCTQVANADQRDTNGDGYGNLCDADLDNNGMVNTRDLALFKTAFGQTGANLDADLNGNGSVNTQDLAIFKGLFGKPPGPSGLAP